MTPTERERMIQLENEMEYLIDMIDANFIITDDPRFDYARSLVKTRTSCEEAKQ